MSTLSHVLRGFFCLAYHSSLELLTTQDKCWISHHAVLGTATSDRDYAFQNYLSLSDILPILLLLRARRTGNTQQIYQIQVISSSFYDMDKLS